MDKYTSCISYLFYHRNALFLTYCSGVGGYISYRRCALHPWVLERYSGAVWTSYMITCSATRPSNFFGPRSIPSNRLHLLKCHSCAHVFQELFFSIALKVKRACMILWIAMRITELLLALTLYRCKCELFLTAFLRANIPWHP